MLANELEKQKILLEVSIDNFDDPYDATVYSLLPIIQGVRRYPGLNVNVNNNFWRWESTELNSFINIARKHPGWTTKEHSEIESVEFLFPG